MIFRRLSLAKQLIIMFVGMALLSQLSILLMFYLKTEDRLDRIEELMTIRNITSTYQRISTISTSDRGQMAKLLSNAEVSFLITEQAMTTAPLTDQRLSLLFSKDLAGVEIFRKRIDNSIGLVLEFWFSDEWEECILEMQDGYLPDGCPHIIYSFPLDHNQWLNAITDDGPQMLLVMMPIIISSLVTLIGVTLITIVAVKRMTKPIQKLSDTAEKFGRGESTQRLPLEGPKELIILTQSFNQMQERLIRFVQDRTKMLASISHDLRTPITSLRLRAEFVDNQALRDKMIHTLEDMQTMVESLLTFARQESIEETSHKIDLVAAIRDLVEEYPHHVSLSGLPSYYLSCQYTAMRRALRNLIDNAIKYGQSASIHVYEHNQRLCIAVKDQGLGIPENKLSEVFEPFVRLDKARNIEQGSVGLGLSIARTIIHKHGGEIRAMNEPDGLKVVIELPL